ncbi:MAG: OmpA family protein [Polyangiaceae bacterium]|nr:OmpA family protein [Polyangiaceae bacterium]
MKARGHARSDGYTIDDLRPLLVGPEQHRLESLEQKLETPEGLAETVGKVLPRATVISQGHGEELSASLRPIIVSTIHETVRKDPKAFADAIYPSIGPAIRKAVSAALHEFVERMDALIQRTMTLESVKWRIEAARTGRPFAEVVLRHSFAYRVEHVFLMHRESALVLEHVTTKANDHEDPDQISAMLAAIDDFSRDAFHQEEGGLSYFRVGELTGIVEQGPHAVLVAIVRGVANKSVEKHLVETLEQIHERYADLLARFKGDVAAFAPAREALIGCLQEEVIQKPKQYRVFLMLGGAAIVLLLLLGLPPYLRHKRFDTYVDALRQEPGISIIDAGGKWGWGFAVEGLRDPLATDPASLLASHGLRPERVALHFEPIYSLDPRLTERRALHILDPPAGVSLEMESGTLIAAGVAPRAWIERTRIVTSALPGVQAFDDTRLYEAEAITDAQAAAATIEGVSISFDRGSTRVAGRYNESLDTVALAARQLFESAPRGGFSAHIEILGQADQTGLPEVNRRITEERAENVAAELRARGIAPDKLVLRGLGQSDPPARRVNFTVRLVPRT